MTEKQKKLRRVLVPAVIALAVAAIWFAKNQSTPPPKELDTPLEITAVDLEEIKSHELPIILDFGSESCGPCREMAPALKAMNEEMQGKAIIQYTDVWKYPEAGKEFPLQVIPTQIFINADGTPYVPSDKLLEEIPGFQLYSTRDTTDHVLTAHQGGLTQEQMRAILAEMGVDS